MTYLGEIFSRIYAEDAWGGGSGPGSNPDQAREYLKFLRSILDDLHIFHVLDVGCGDWQIYRDFRWHGCDYEGCDVVGKLKDRLPWRPEMRFHHGELSDYRQQCFDLIIIKDVLQHLPEQECRKILSHARHSQWVLITNDFPRSRVNGPDIEAGGYRAINFCAPPWQLKPHSKLTWDARPYVKQSVLFSGSDLPPAEVDPPVAPCAR